MTDAKTTGKHVTETSLGSAVSAKWRDTFTEEPDGGKLLVWIWRGPRGRNPPGLLDNAVLVPWSGKRAAGL